ncbi:MAG: SpoIVB peptidase [Oscillospiraceae bacterium]|nr:SpoIVB peptidase [Oscillospiraceae bacterium]
MEKERGKPGGWAFALQLLAALAAACLVLGLAFGLAVGRTVRAAPCAAAGETRTKTVIPVGQAVGMKLFSRGVLVVGLSEVETAEGTRTPAKSCGLRTGDIITGINEEQVDSIDQVSALIQELQGGEMDLEVTRNGKTVQLTGEAVQCATDSSYRFGAWLRDSMAGIGTITFYDPDTGRFAALGHGINDVDTGLLMPIQSGGIMSASVTGVEKGASGAPGQLHGTFDLTRDVGSLTVNSDYGVFGLAGNSPWAGEEVEVASRSQVQTGAATILANISGEQVEEYAVTIERVYPAALSETRNLMVHVTDERLLEATGGIVQGMSGSPILQNGRLVGAVTHVLLDDPTRGYGILAETMLTMME